MFDFFVEYLESHNVAKLEFSLWIFFTHIFEMSRLDCGDIVRSLSAGERGQESKALNMGDGWMGAFYVTKGLEYHRDDMRRNIQ